MLERMCRTCLATSGELVPIFSNDYYVHNLPDKLMTTIRIEIQKNDDLPKMICKKCIFLVDSLYCFKDQCKMAERKLKKSLKGELSDDIESLLNYNHTNRDVDQAENRSDVSSEENYHIEYVSEEARLEVESARRRTRNARKKHKNDSGIKVKSVEILPPELRNNPYKNINAATSHRSVGAEIDDMNLSDSDTRSSINVSEFQDTSQTEKNQIHRSIHDKLKPGSKRKIESNDNINQLSKVSKKGLYKQNDLDDTNTQYIEVSDNQVTRISNCEPIEMNDDANTIQINIIANNKEQDKKDKLDKKLPSTIPTISRVTNSTDIETQKVLDFRMQNLIKKVVLNIPDVCGLCSETFESYSEVLKHKIAVHVSLNQEQYFCPVCLKQFNSNYDLLSHLDKHPDIRSYTCILCSKNFYTEEVLRAHLTSHADLRELRCQICSKKHQKAFLLFHHLETEHISKTNLTCTFCSVVSKSKDAFQAHLLEDHKKNPENQKHPENEKHLDSKKSPSSKSMKSPEKPESSSIKSKEKETKQHDDDSDDVLISYPCPYCEQNLDSKESLREHVSTHAQYTCMVCELSFNSQEERTQHMQEHMKPQPKNDRKKFRCRVCHDILVSRVAYGQHLKDKHWNSKQTSEILRELSETSVNEQLNKSTASTASETITLTL